ncbi:MAG: hypothetical protein ACE5DX_00850 [Candidatus Dojkabacteria bacterium]
MMAKQLKGITLIESLVYLAVFGVMFFAVMQFVFTVIDSNRRANSINEIDKAAIFINQHINDSFDTASSVNTGLSTFDDNNGVLRLNVTGGYIEYNLDSDRLNFDNNGVTSSYLSPLGLELSSFFVEQIQDKESNVIGARITTTVIAPKETDISKTITTSYTLD